jgi:L-glyceraldehyde 3-phosphate reductase
MTYHADPKRYEALSYRRVGRSGLVLPAISLGLWHNFGDTTSIATQRQLLRTAFDLGINHFDLANNYGPPYGSAETNFGRLLREDFKAYRDELIISSKAGWDMWPGPYGKGGGSRKYVLASLDQSLQRLGLDYVDIFYSHRFDPDTPLEETASALAQAVQQGKALYIGISSYSAGKTREIAALLREWKVPLLIHQPAYNLFNRWIEKDLLDATDELGAGVIAFTPLAQGLLTDKYLKGIPDDARINRPGGGSLKQEHLSEANIERARALDKDRAAPRPDAGAACADVDAARPARELGTHRREPARADRRQRGRARACAAERRGAGRGRQVRGGGRRQPLGKAVDRFRLNRVNRVACGVR